MPPAEHCRTCQRLMSSASAGHFPFCSARCRDRDLGQWLNGRYTIVQELEQPGDGDLDSDQP